MISFRLDLATLQRRLSLETGLNLKIAHIEEWLERAGIASSGETWIAPSQNVLSLFRSEELIAASPSSDQSVRKSVAAIPCGRATISDYSVPSILAGPPRPAQRAWRRIVTSALKERTWGTVFGGIARVPIDLVPGGILFHGPVPATADTHILAYLIRQEIREACPRVAMTPYAAAEAERALLMAGAKELWFCLGILGGGVPLLSPFACEQGMDIRNFSRDVLWSLVRFWPDLVNLSKRFMIVRGIRCEWPSWASNAFRLAQECGAATVGEVQGIKELSASEAGTTLGRYLIRCIF